MQVHGPTIDMIIKSLEESERELTSIWEKPDCSDGIRLAKITGTISSVRGYLERERQIDLVPSPF